ncbi:unannotated protein [freshwater metagenome]|uniref:Unannotated protein n=1 Tax=freshwater metagenome TaxID=449393 RepID=A0A6J7GED5_9ZZZZ
MPARLTGATKKSLSRWEDLFDLLEDHPALWADARTSVLLVKREGRPRKPGEWALPLLAYVNSAERELSRWHERSPDLLWERAGFAARPSYHAVYKNFNALEEHEDVFRAIAARLIQLAVEKSGGKVGHAVHVDGTEAEAHSRLIHDCQGDEIHSCKKQAKSPRRNTNADARDERHRLAKQVPFDANLNGAAEKLAADERGLRVLVGGCWYRLSDNEAGVRAYVTSDGKVKRFWAGYYCAKAVDHYTGGVLAVSVTSASIQEHVAYPELYAQVKQHLGQAPKAVVADRGYSVGSVFALHTRDGVASVIPWRKSRREQERKDYLPKYDRHGIPHCKHCSGEAVFHRFQHDAGVNDEPRLWYRCAVPATEACQGVQSILCKENWRLLLPLWRTAPAYQVLRARHAHYEAAHHRWRERYSVAGDSRADRSKRRGLGVQQLRASVALVIEWLNICHRQGWLGGPVLNEAQETQLTTAEANEYVEGFVKARHALGLSSVADPDLHEEHRAEVADAYGNSASGFGSASAYGDDIGKMLVPSTKRRTPKSWRDVMSDDGVLAEPPG